MNNLLLGLAMIMASSETHAQEIFFGYGIGAFGSAKYSTTEVKTIDLGYRMEIYNGLYWQFKSGDWIDTSNDRNRRGSLFLFTGPSLLIDLAPVEIRTGLSIGAIETTDSYLGGHFPQFNEDLYFGVRDRHGNGIGVKYEHISSAGIFQPNEGRDFVILEVSQRW